MTRLQVLRFSQQCGWELWKMMLLSLASDSWCFEGLFCHLQRSRDPRMYLRPADPGRPTHKFLQKSKNYDILIWCHIPREQNPKIFIIITQIWIITVQSTLPATLSIWVWFWCITSSGSQCASRDSPSKMCDKNLYSGNISYCRIHTESLQQFDTRSGSPVQQISSAHAVLSCADAECILKHHHLSP